MSNETRTAAHAALDRASPENLAQTAHNIVENLCGVIDAIARQAAAQTRNYLFPARPSTFYAQGVEHRVGPDCPACNPPPSTSPPPSKETEAELLQSRQVKALEQIAYALTNAKGIQ